MLSVKPEKHGFGWAVLLLVLSGCGQRYGERLMFNGGELYYTSRVTKQEAQKLGEYLVGQGFFDGTRKSVQLDKRGETYLFRAVMKKNVQDNEVAHRLFQLFAIGLSLRVFDGSPVEIHLCDERLRTKKVITMNE